MGSGGCGLRGVYARHRLDLSLSDAAFGLLACVVPGEGWGSEGEILRLCSLEDEGLVSLSVRSGWDLWLGASGLRPGDEVLVSAVTHPDMVGIVRGHGLRAVPVDIEPDTLAPRPEALEAALTPRTRVVLVAHLFGGRIDLGSVARFAREHGLLLVEDCAQAFRGPRSMGHPAADVSMHSFGTLKTSTALGGAVLRVGDGEILCRMRRTLEGYPRQRRGEYAGKLVRADTPNVRDPDRVAPEVSALLSAASAFLAPKALRPKRVISAFAGLHVLPLGEGPTSSASR